MRVTETYLPVVVIVTHPLATLIVRNLKLWLVSQQNNCSTWRSTHVHPWTASSPRSHTKIPSWHRRRSYLWLYPKSFFMKTSPPSNQLLLTPGFPSWMATRPVSPSYTTGGRVRRRRGRCEKRNIHAKHGISIDFIQLKISDCVAHGALRRVMLVMWVGDHTRLVFTIVLFGNGRNERSWECHRQSINSALTELRFASTTARYCVREGR